jgi:hypothetical protein
MRKLLLTLSLVAFILALAVQPVMAQRAASPTPSPLVATDAGVATGTAEVASPSAIVLEKAQEQKDNDITEIRSKKQDALAAFLDEHPPEPLNWNNFIEHAIRYAVNQGMSANIIVLVVLFPLIASIIAASRHIIGLRGFGIYIPAVLSVALVSTGLLVGIIIFVAIISVALFSKRILKHLHLSYLPRTAMLLWLISLAILIVLLAAPYLNISTLVNLSIFPLLILVLLSENFLDAQSSTKPSDALALAIETLGLAFISGFILRWDFMQRVALLEPEILILGTAVFNIIIGKFVGLRVSEWFRFRPIIEE